MAGTHDVAAALGQPGRAATSTQEVLTTPHVRRSGCGRESHGAVSEGLLQAQGDDAFAREQPFGLVPHEVPTFPDVRSSAGAGEGLLHDERLLQEQGQGLSSLLVDTSPPRTGLSDPLRPERVPLASQGRGSGEVRISDVLGTFVAPSQGRQKDKTSREGYDGSFGIQDPHSLGRGPTSPIGRTVQQQDVSRSALHQGDPWVTTERGGGEPPSLAGTADGQQQLLLKIEQLEREKELLLRVQGLEQQLVQERQRLGRSERDRGDDELIDLTPHVAVGPTAQQQASSRAGLPQGGRWATTGHGKGEQPSMAPPIDMDTEGQTPGPAARTQGE